MICDRMHYIEKKVRQQISITNALETFQHPAVMNPFQGLTTRYLQLKYYREHFGLLLSELITTTIKFFFFFLSLNHTGAYRGEVGSCCLHKAKEVLTQLEPGVR